MKPNPNLARGAVRLLAIAGTALAAQASHAYCFTIFDGAGRLVYQSVDEPFDLSRPYSESLAARYSPRHQLVVTESFCPGAGAASGPASDSGVIGLATVSLGNADARTPPRNDRH